MFWPENFSITEVIFETALFQEAPVTKYLTCHWHSHLKAIGKLI